MATAVNISANWDVTANVDAIRAAQTADFHPQDWALIVEALVTWTGNPTDLNEPREQRAYELAEVIAASHGLTPSDLVANIDPDWNGELS